VVVLGTQFVVRRTAEETAVTVIDGRVTVESDMEIVPAPAPDEPGGTFKSAPSTAVAAPTASRTFQLAARQRLRLDASGNAELTTIAPDEKPAAWRQRRLVFSSERLEDVAAEFNRFNVDAIHIEDPHLRDLRIGGVFDAGDPGSLLAFLEGLDGVVVRTGGDGIHIVSRSD
jgi:transmembrane sensor